jgi:type I thyroxine 5'-deiodinase
MMDKYCDKADFLTVYILEAHAQDEWPISSARWSATGAAIKFEQHKTIEDRKQVAQQFAQDYAWRWPVVLDTMDNLFEKSYASWPIRFFVLERDPSPSGDNIEQDGGVGSRVKMSLIGFPRNASYHMGILYKWLRMKFDPDQVV